MIMTTQQPFIITISRELGSGGHTVGRILAERLGVRYSDKELIKALREQFHLTTDAIEKLKGEKKDWLTSLLRKIIAMPKAENVVEWDESFVKEYQPNISSDEIFEAEKQILRGIAEEGSCVIAGRSGFYVLKDFPNKIDIFITAARENRIKRVMAKQNLSEEEAEAAIDGDISSDFCARLTAALEAEVRAPLRLLRVQVPPSAVRRLVERVLDAEHNPGRVH